MSREDRAADEHRPYIDLLDRIAITKERDQVDFLRIRNRIDEVRGWFASRTGWPLVERAGVMTLLKGPVIAGPAQGLPGLRTPLDYELFTWILWYAEHHEVDQFLLAEVIDEITIEACRHDPGHIDWTQRSQRESLARAIGAHEAIGAVRMMDGELGTWVRGAEQRALVLYEFTPVAWQITPDMTEELFAATAYRQDGAALAAPDIESASPSERLYRHLLLSPALYAKDDPEAFALLRDAAERKRVADDIQEHTGWEMEFTLHYAGLLRYTADATRQRVFPGRSARMHVALLLAARLRDGARLREGGWREFPPDKNHAIRLTRPTLERVMSELRETHRANWAKAMTDATLDELVDSVVDLLRDWNMAEVDEDDGVTFLPLMARIVGVYTEDGEGLDTREEAACVTI